MNIEIESKKTLNRIVSAIDKSMLSTDEWKQFESRLQEHFPSLFSLLLEVYGAKYDFHYHLHALVEQLRNGFAERPKAQKSKDKLRLKTPAWFNDENMLGMACYVDLFAGDLKKLEKKIPYLQDLGVTYLHLMPLYKAPLGDSDGGYAVSDYRQVDIRLGTTDDLRKLAKSMAKAGINLVLDFVFNHTSDEHEWAMKAKQGDSEFQEYYWMFNDKDIPNQYEQHLREIFPQVRRGNFTFNPQANKWVWTTFNNFQWDVNYSNPAVFNAITSEMLFLANLGCDALRLDALAFIWKELGTNCENQPKAHTLIRAFNRCLKIVAPSVVFKSEAIVHPDEVVKYIDKDECELSYNPLLMALIWNSVATRKTKLLTSSMQKSFAISNDCSWVNYARCHDDIGWTFDDDIASHMGINGYDHRQFLNQFYTGRFDGTFSSGVAFGENPENGDCRVCGSLASLAGLEQAIAKNDPVLIEHAVKRVLLIHAIILSIGGIPLLYSGDELGLLNDYSYEKDDSKKHDGRWVHRIAVNDKSVAQAQQVNSPFYDIAQGLKHMIGVRKSYACFGKGHTTILDAGNQHIFAYKRIAQNSGQPHLLAIYNFADHEQTVHDPSALGIEPKMLNDAISQKPIALVHDRLVLKPLQVLWLISD